MPACVSRTGVHDSPSLRIACGGKPPLGPVLAQRDARWPRRASNASQHRRGRRRPFQHQLARAVPPGARSELGQCSVWNEGMSMAACCSPSRWCATAKEEDRRPLVLLLATRGAERHPGLAVPEREGWVTASCGDACAGHEAVGQAVRAQPEHLAASAHRENPRPGIDRRGLQPAAGRGGADHVAPAVDDVDMHGVRARSRPRRDYGGLSGAGRRGSGPVGTGRRRRGRPSSCARLTTVPGRRSIEASGGDQPRGASSL